MGLPQCRHTPHSQPSSDNNSANTHQQIMRTRKTCNSCIHVCVRQSEVLIQLPLLKSLAFGCQNASLNRILHTFECLHSIRFLFFTDRNLASFAFMILMMGVHSVFSSLWFPAVTSDAASSIVGCTAVAAKANRPQTTPVAAET